MLYLVKKYLIFLWQSTNEHGVHSPFVFNFLTKGIYIKPNKKKLQKIINYKRELNNDKNIINVTDFGAGSRVFNSSKRSIHLIAKNAGISNKKIKIILKLSNYFSINSILEIGTSLGIGTYTLATANPKAQITTLEGCAETLKIAKLYLSKYSSNSINYIQGDFSKTLEKNLTKKYDLIYFDGNHQKKPTINYFESCLKVAHNDSIFIFDDIYWSKEMTEAWKYIKNHPKVTVTIDFFHLGIVFFRKEQAKENFIIRA